MNRTRYPVELMEIHERFYAVAYGEVFDLPEPDRTVALNELRQEHDSAVRKVEIRWGVRKLLEAVEKL